MSNPERRLVICSIEIDDEGARDETRSEYPWIDYGNPEGGVALTEFLSFVENAVELVPEACRQTAVVSTRGGGEYGSNHDFQIVIQWSREENDAEYADRMARNNASQAASESAERAAYERLKQKFG